MRYATGLLVSLVCLGAFAGQPASRTLSFEDRVKAQEAIERVYYSHQLGATKSFEQAVPQAVLEAKVHKDLDETAALSVYWKTGVTDEMLQRELERMAAGTKMPRRLLELFAALGDDPFLIKECLARPALVDRLAHNFYAFDPAFHVSSREQAESIHRQLTAGEIGASEEHPNRTVSEFVVNDFELSSSKTDSPAHQRLTSQEFQTRRAELPARVGQVSNVRENAGAFGFSVVLSETTKDLRVANYVVPKTSWDTWWSNARLRLNGDVVTAVATGLTKLPPVKTATPLCVDDDTWNNGSMGTPQITDPRENHTAVWTGTLMVIWGGSVGTQMLASGGRYDPATDSWSPTSMTGAPTARAYHTAVWTGSQMVIWGGWTGPQSYLNTGGRYNPTTDSWTTTSVVGAPTARLYHTAIWTGSLMVVWGGYDGVNTGARYNPVTDSWIPTSVSGAPSGRYHHSAVWTGSRMVIWGGANGLNDGGRYDPIANVWTAVSLNAAPLGRFHHSAVWTGNSMLVWGGTTGVYPVEIVTNTGGRYDPATDTWTSMSATNAPGARTGHGAVWTGSRMVIWGGYFHDIGNVSVNSGGRYDPVTDSWTPTSTTSAPPARAFQSTIWTGGVMIVWGGGNNFGAAGGGRYDPSTDTWTPVSTLGPPAPRGFHSAIWTGSLMVVWGGTDALNSGGRYDPASDSWTPTSMAGAPSLRRNHTAVWTGSRMVIWGGFDNYTGYANTGGQYDPVADVWKPTSTAGAPLGRSNHTAVWTGSLMVVWGGLVDGDSGTGGRYDPAADSWTPASTIGAPTGRSDHTAVWTGSKMVVWGGNDSSHNNVNTGGRYDPSVDAWTPTALAGAPAARYAHTALWAGNVMVVWGGDSSAGRLNSGGRYNASSDVWTAVSTAAAPAARSNHTAVWTGSKMVVWGGYNTSGTVSNTGGRYDLATDSWLPTTVSNAPLARVNHTAVWTGSLMLVWGGLGDTSLNSGGRYVLGASVDDDGDGYSECQGDCNDADPTMYPGAPQLCDGKNNDCNDPAWPAVPSNEADTDRDGFGMCQGDCDDNDASVYPGAPQLCDGKNNDCSNVTWPVVPANEADADHDGYRICAGDCDDTRAWVHRGATETCNGVDDNCDGVIDNGGAALCSDGNSCTDDRCDGAAGCAHTNNTNVCDDGNACTTGDICLGGSCLSGAGSLVCDDGNVCTTDSCNPATGCVFTNNTITCNDGDACTVADTCSGGSCHGTTIVCNDNNACTDDSCDPATGACVFANDDTNACSDENPCTQTDACHAGICSGSSPVQCNGACPPGFTQVGGLCQKTYDIGVGLLDNLGAFCDSTGTNRYNNCGYLNYGFHWTDLGSSLAAVTRVDVQLESGINCGGPWSSLKLNGVVAGNFGRVGTCSCSSVHGTVSLPNLAAGAYVIAGVNTISITPGASCEGLSKNVNLGNNYARVTVTYAPHNDACQSGTCDPATGACNFSNVPDGNTCSDDNVCTSGDACVGGSCFAGSPIVCRDGNACTSDTCNPTTGCVFTNNTIGCDDGNPCTVGDACAGGVCQSGTPAPPPSEVQNVMAAADKSTFSWSTSAGATRYDVVRGNTATLPVGAGGGNELCFDDLAGTTLVDTTLPAVGVAFWYLSRGESVCGIGTFGEQSDGAPRMTTTCP